MDVSVTQSARDDLDELDTSLRVVFIKHMEKLTDKQKRRHMRFGLPFYVMDVSRNARLVYTVEKETIYVIRCFKNHKEYERWYRSYK